MPEGTRSGPLGLGEPRGLTGRGAKHRRWKPQWGFQGHVPDHREGCPPAAFRRRRKLFPKGAFSLLLSFCDTKRKKEALRPAPRAAPWTRDGGSFGDKRRQPFGAEKPAGPVPGGRTDCPSKTSWWDVFESIGVSGETGKKQVPPSPQYFPYPFTSASKNSIINLY